MPSDPLRPLTTALTDLGGQRVWSLIVSVFGDLAQEEASAIDGPVLSAIMTAMDVRPEAIRVALHRLRNDGWITSQKSGRTSRHSLTAHGRAETIAAAKRIYAGPDDMPTRWQIILTEGADPDQRARIIAEGYTALTSRVFAGPQDAGVPGDALLLQSDRVPHWLKTQLTPARLIADYENLHLILTRIDAELPEGSELSPLEVAILRCLIVHNWRRLVLKHPDLPAALYTDAWRAHDCRALVSKLLHRFPRPDLATLLEEPRASTSQGGRI
ncbi:PaaX family transcriptional regulator C-terminal domain-containing protein [uncultured Roseobacter sp.]|uniref:PaaX family transcriptional regulator C-terminal domain-containing protein n=1 Tax=uncultured Roseobacter sp. TaxID=114847 RepID=UPI00262FFF62|nr:PaaX family transcriptional regulator C-terminal domain-containing protein [uncultured Roseobacter sp.]